MEVEQTFPRERRWFLKHRESGILSKGAEDQSLATPKEKQTD